MAVQSQSYLKDREDEHGVRSWPPRISKQGTKLPSTAGALVAPEQGTHSAWRLQYRPGQPNLTSAEDSSNLSLVSSRPASPSRGTTEVKAGHAPGKLQKKHQVSLEQNQPDLVLLECQE